MNLMPTKKPKTVDQVMGVFNKTIEELSAVSEAADASVQALNETRMTIDQEIEAATKESRRAKKIQAQLQAVIQG